MKRSTGEKIFDVCNVLFMIVFSIVMLYPYVNQLAISFNQGADTSFGGITIWPREFTLANYNVIFENKEIIRATMVTVLRVLCATFTGLLVCTGAAYALTKKELPLRNFLTWFLIIPVYINVGMIPTYILYRHLALLNNFLVYFLPGAFVFYNMLIIRTFLKSLPASLEESAAIEGANEIQILTKIILPICMPVVATVALWISVGAWNDWTTTLFYIQSRKLYTLQFVIMQIIKQSEVLQQLVAESALTGGSVVNDTPTSDSVKAAAIIFSTLPIVMLYPYLQKYFVKGVTIGAIKE